VAVPKKEPAKQSLQKEEQQQQSKSSASDKEFNKEHLEAVKRYCMICLISYMSCSQMKPSGILKNNTQNPK
jgi:hypothetical protein